MLGNQRRSWIRIARVAIATLHEIDGGLLLRLQHGRDSGNNIVRILDVVDKVWRLDSSHNGSILGRELWNKQSRFLGQEINDDGNIWFLDAREVPKVRLLTKDRFVVRVEAFFAVASLKKDEAIYVCEEKDWSVECAI